MTNPETADAPEPEKRPSQALGERMLAARDVLSKATDLFEEVLASAHGRPRPQPTQVAVVASPPVDYRRFFPAMERLIGDIEAEAKKLAILAEGFDKTF